MFLRSLVNESLDVLHACPDAGLFVEQFRWFGTQFYSTGLLLRQRLHALDATAGTVHEYL